MKKNVVLTVIFFLLNTIQSQISKVQILNQPTSLTRVLSISDDNQILISGGDDDTIYIFKINNQTLKYDYHSKIQVSTHHIGAAQITGDGQRLLIVDENSNGNAYVLKLNPSTGEYDLYQNISMGDSTYTFGGVISEDYEMVIVGKYSGNIYFYQLNSAQQYEFKYFISVQPFISHLQLAHDKSMLIVSVNGKNIYIYEDNGNKFAKKQTLELSETKFRRTFLTKDKEYLVISEEVGQRVYICQWNGSLFLKKKVFSGLNSSYASISQDHQWIIISEYDKISIYYYHNDEVSLYRSFNTNLATFNLMTNDLVYLFDAHNFFIDVYKFWEPLTEYCLTTMSTICGNLQACEGYDQFQIRKTQICETCNIFGCKEYQICSSCNQTNQYFQNSRCQTHKNSLNCLACNEAEDYFFNFLGKCQKCSIENCVDCSSLTECKECSQKYYLDSSSCSLCEISYCSICSSSNICSECVDGFDIENGKCVQPLSTVAIVLICIIVVLIVVIVIIAIMFYKRSTPKSQQKIIREQSQKYPDNIYKDTAQGMNMVESRKVINEPENPKVPHF